MASAPFVKLASAARKRLEFLDKAGSDIRNGQLGLGKKVLKGVGIATAADLITSPILSAIGNQEGAEAQSQEGEARS